MCLIIYSPTGKHIEREVFDYAQGVNSDGIGIMSRDGVEKFVGRRHRKRAWRYLRRMWEQAQYTGESLAYGVHFRWRTHGDINRANTHPYKAPESDAYVMHNGIIALTSSRVAASESDTSVFVRDYMIGAPDHNDTDHVAFYKTISRMIGGENKLLIMHATTGQFTLCNEDSGFWKDGLWYSNDYSVPSHISPYGKYNASDWEGVCDLESWPGRSNYRNGNMSKVAVAVLQNGRASYNLKYTVNTEGTAVAVLTPEEDEYKDRRTGDCLVGQRIDDDYYRAVAAEHAADYYDNFCLAGHGRDPDAVETENSYDDEDAQAEFEAAHEEELAEMSEIKDDAVRYRLTRMAARNRRVA